MSRSVKEIISDLTSYDPTKGTGKLSHDCYMILVGHLQDTREVQELRHLVKTSDGESDNDKEAAPSLTIMESENVETFLEHITLKYNYNELNSERDRHFVYEDNFNPSLLIFMEGRASYDRLKRVCRKYEELSKENVDNVIREHTERSNKNFTYFTEKGLSEDDARAAAFAIAFYTGSRSESLSRGASLVARRSNGVDVGVKTEAEMREASIILYYLVKGLSYIPYHWGYVIRACQLKDHELEIYTPGALITWLQFSSSKRGKEVAKGGDFDQRNTQFRIYSLTGRPIQQFSNYDHEDEVLFLPHSTFFVFKHVVGYHGKQHTIYMRQVELGMSKWSVLWVDDQIFVEKWENKSHMEYAAAKSMNMNVHFIPKSCTDYAISFLKSPFGQRLKNQENFRIVTDMNRTNERPSHNAGARFIKQLRQLGFNNHCLVFTSDQKQSESIIRSELTNEECRNTKVSVQTEDLRYFVSFK